LCHFEKHFTRKGGQARPTDDGLLDFVPINWKKEKGTSDTLDKGKKKLHDDAI
jgi:hypothetical protein